MSTNEEQARMEIAKAIDGLPPREQVRVLKKFMRKYGHEFAGLERDIEHTKSEKEELEHTLAAHDSLIAWSDGTEIKLEKNDCSRLHLLREAGKSGRFHVYVDGVVQEDGLGNEFYADHCPFVVKHDWSAALDGSEGLDGEVPLPYDISIFEFRISGRSIIATAVNDHMKLFPNRPLVLFIESMGHWFMLDFGQELHTFIWDQVRAISIALDAEVATHTVVRAPHELNRKREKAGRVPLNEYRVVDLSRRHRVANSTSGESGRKVRLHFRRGHWRHFETYKTWIRWCLVGDPDLGFISKHYTL